METNEAVQILWRIVNLEDNSCQFDGRFIRLKVSDANKEELNKACVNLQLSYEFNLDNTAEVRIDSAQNKTYFFYNEADFTNRGVDALPDFMNSHYVILANGDQLLQKLPNEKFSAPKALLFNFYHYHEILNFLEMQEGFMSFYSRSDLRFVLFTSEKGPFDIQLNLHETRVKNLEDLGPVLESLKKDFQKIDFVQFFKAAVINTIHEYSIEDRFFYFMQSLRVILNVASRDHYIYIRNFDFDKVKTKFKEERNKYFESIEKNIDSISRQVTSFPLTFGASIFAGYQVKDRPAILILVFLAYALYTLIAWRILNITSFNTANIKTDAENEESKINTTYEVLHSEFEPDFNKIYTKISRLEGLIQILRVVLVGLLVCFVVFAAYQSFFAWSTPAKPTEVRIVK